MKFNKLSYFYKILNMLIKSFILLLFSISLTSCFNKRGSGSSELLDQTFGLKLTVIEGDQQISVPGKLFQKPLTIQATNIVGEPISGLTVKYSLISGADFYITPSTVKTNISGFAAVEVRGPDNYNQTAEVLATIDGTSVSKIFTLTTNDVSPGTRFQIESTSGSEITSGKPVGFIVRLLNDNGSIYDYNGPLSTTWLISTHSSWTGVAPSKFPLNGTTYECNFVGGVCLTEENIVFTDSSEPTIISVGDGPSGFADAFAYTLNVKSDVPKAVVIANGLGGPNANAEALTERIVLKASDPDITFAAAIIDNSGNYIQDASTVIWNSSTSNIKNYLSTLSGQTTTFSPTRLVTRDLPGKVSATVSGYPIAYSGEIIVDSGDLDHFMITASDGVNGSTCTGSTPTCFAGDPIVLSMYAVDVDENLIGQNELDSGFNGQYKMNFGLTNFQTGASPSAGTIPWFGLTSSLTTGTFGSNTYKYPGQKTIVLNNWSSFLNFNLGTNQSIGNYSLIFFDATNFPDSNQDLSPVLTVNHTPDSRFTVSKSGSITFKIKKGPPHHINLRAGLGAEATPICKANVVLNTINFENILNLINYTTTGLTRRDCDLMNFNVGVTSGNLYYAIEDRAGNFIANINGKVISDQFLSSTTYDDGWLGAVQTPGLNIDSSYIKILSNSIATQGGLRIQGDYNGVTYDSEIGGTINPDPFHHFKLYITPPSSYAISVHSLSLKADTNYTVAVFRQDQYNNNVTSGPMQSTFNINTVVSGPTSGTLANAPNGSANYQPVNGTYTVTFSPGNASASIGIIPQLIVPNVSIGTVTVTLSNHTGSIPSSAISPGDQVTSVVTTGTLNTVDIRSAPGLGSGFSYVNPPNQPLNFKIGQQPVMYLSGLDLRGNYISNVTGDWQFTNLTPFDAIGYSVVANQNALVLNKPGVADNLNVRVLNYTSTSGISNYFNLTTGSVNLTIGDFYRLKVLVDNPGVNKVAGTTFGALLQIVDSKDNVLTNITGTTGTVPLSFDTKGSTTPTLSNNVPTLNGAALSATPTNYVFTNGELTLNNISYFNSSDANPLFRVFATIGTLYKDGVSNDGDIKIVNDSLNRLHIDTALANVPVTQANKFTVYAEDAWGNRITSGTGANMTVQFNLTEPLLTTQDITSVNNFTGASSVSGSNDITVTGQLNNGFGEVWVNSTLTGVMTTSASVLSGEVLTGTNVFESVNYTSLIPVAGVRWSTPILSDHTASPTNFINQFCASLVDYYGNIITSNSTDRINISISSPISSNFYSGNTNKRVTNGVACFSDLRLTKVGTYSIKAEAQDNFNNPISYSGSPVKTGGVQVCDGSVSCSEPEESLLVNFGSQRKTIVLIENEIAAFTDGAGNLTNALGGAGRPVPFNSPAPSTDGYTLQAGAYSFAAQVRVVDESYNTVPTVITVNMQSVGNSDPHLIFDSNPKDTAPTGIVNFTVIANRKGSNQKIVAASGSVNSSDNSVGYNILANSPSKIVAILPGQTLSEGAPNFHAAAVTSPVPVPQIAGTPFNVLIYNVDNLYNVTTLDSSTSISLTTSDTSDTDPTSKTLSQGTTYFSVTNYKAGLSGSSHWVSPGISSGTAYSVITSSTFTLNGNSATKCLVYFTPDQTLTPNGSSNLATALSGSVGAKSACSSYSLKVLALDNWNNVDTTYAKSFTLSTPNDANAQYTPSATNNFVAGSADITLKTVSSGNTKALNISCPGDAANGFPVLGNNNSPSYNVTIGTAAHIVSWFPTMGQSYDFTSGHQTLTGAGGAITGTLATFTAGQTYPVSVISTDACYNFRNTDSHALAMNIKQSGSPVSGTSYSFSGSGPLSSGSASFNLTYYLSGLGFNIDSGNSSYLNKATNFDVNQKSDTGLRLLVKLPLQNFTPGQSSYTSSITGTPAKQTVNYNYNVTIYAVDNHGNTLADSTSTVSLTPSGGSADFISAGTITLANGVGSITLNHTSPIASLSLTPLVVNSGTFTYSPVASSSFRVLPTLGTPSLALSDNTTSNANYIKATNVLNAAITISSGTAYKYCLSESMSSRPSSGTNTPINCTNGIGNVDASGWSSAPLPTPLTIATSTNNNKTFYLWIQDDAFNVTQATITDTIILDNVAPNTPTVAVTNGSFINASPTGITIGNDTDMESGVSGPVNKYCICDQASATGAPTVTFNSCTGTTCSGWLSSKPTQVTVGALGSRKLWLYTMDNANNISSVGNYSYFYDQDSPTTFGIGGLLSSADVTSDQWLGGDNVPKPTWTPVVDISNITYDFTVKNYPSGTPVGGSCTQSLTVAQANLATTTVNTLTGCNLNNGSQYSLNMKATDQATNFQNAMNNDFAFTVDTTAPNSPTNLNITNGTLNVNYYVNATTITVNWDEPNPIGDLSSYKVVLATNSSVDGISNLVGGCTNTYNVSTSGVNGSTLSQTFTGCTLVNGTTYKIFLTAYDPARNPTALAAFPFTISTGADKFILTALNTTPTAGTPVNFELVAQKPDGSTDLTYNSNISVNFTTTASSSSGKCSFPSAVPVAPDLTAVTTGTFSAGSLTLNVAFTTGTATFSARLYKADVSKVLTAAKNGDASVTTGTSAGITVSAAGSSCTRIIDDAVTQTLLTGTTQTKYLATSSPTPLPLVAGLFDQYGNYISVDSAAVWTGSGIADDAVVTSVSNSLSNVGGSVRIFPVTSNNHYTTTATISLSTSVDKLVFSVPPVTYATATWDSTTKDGGNLNLLANNSNSVLFYYNTANDSSSVWRTDSAKSWYSESFGAHRGARGEFPLRAGLVVSGGTTLSIIDLSTNMLFMRFNRGSNNSINSTTDTITAVSASEGKIYLGLNNASNSGSLVVLDFVNDKTYQLSSSINVKSNLSARNDGVASWSAVSGGDNYFGLTYASDAVNSLSAKRIGGVNYVAIATSNSSGNSGNLWILSPTTLIKDSDVSHPITHVTLTSQDSGRLYYYEKNRGLKIKYFASTPINVDFSDANLFDQSSTPRIITAGTVSGGTFSINDLDVSEQSQFDGVGNTNNTIILSSIRGLTIFRENVSSISSSDVKNIASKGQGITGALSTSLPPPTSHNGAIMFSGLGADSYASTNTTGVTALTNIGSYEFWFKPESTLNTASATTHLLSRGTISGGTFSEGSVGFTINPTGYTGTGKLSFWVISNGTANHVTSGTTTWTAGRWYHIAANFNGASGTQLWVNGASQSTNSINLTSFNADDGMLYLGGNTTSIPNFFGAMDEVRVTRTTIPTLYSSSSFTPDSSTPFVADTDTVVLYHLNEYGGITAAFDTYGTTLNLGSGSWLADNVYNTNTLAVVASTADMYKPAASNPVAILEMISAGAWIELQKVGFYNTNTTSKPVENINNTGATYTNVIWFRKDDTDANYFLKDLMLTTSSSIKLNRR